MKKDLSIRISGESYKNLQKLAKKEGRTIKGMFDLIVRGYWLACLANESVSLQATYSNNIDK